jgi:hypothetical protein
MRVCHAGFVLTALVVLVAFACEDPMAEPANGPPNDGGIGGSSGSPAGGSSSSGGTVSPGGTDGAAPDAGLGPGKGPSNFVYRDINHLLGTGQSLSVGSAGNPALSKNQPYRNMMFSTGAIAGGTGLTELVPLVEGIGSPGDVETLSSALANQVTRMARDEVFTTNPDATRSHDLLVSGHGIGGTPYSGLKKGTIAFTNGIAQVTAGKQIADDLGKSYVVRAITNVHGESDQVAGNPAYVANLVEWQSDYEKDIQAITGQTDPVPMLHTQFSSWTKLSTTTSQIVIDQLTAHVQNPGKIVLVGPKYYLEYAADGVHLTNAGYRHMGEDYAKAYRRVVLEGKPWEPVRPIAVTRTGATITVKFAVPAPPLTLDTTLVTNPGNFGFELAETGGAETITRVEIGGPDTVVITLSGAPTGTSPRVRYAYTGTLGAPGGPTTGPRGNLRDSDATASRFGYPLYNWCVHFDEAIP